MFSYVMAPMMNIYRKKDICNDKLWFVIGFILPIEHLNTTESDTHIFARMSDLGGPLGLNPGCVLYLSVSCTVMALLKSHVTHTGTCSWRVELLLHQSPKFFVQQWIFARCVQVPSKFLNHAIGHFLFLARWRKHLHLSSYLNSFPKIVLTFSE